jgi:hypothetical protein
MLTTLLCWLVGHKFTQKVIDGTANWYAFGDAYTVHTHKWKPLSFCIRCGKPNRNYEETK